MVDGLLVERLLRMFVRAAERRHQRGRLPTIGRLRDREFVSLPTFPTRTGHRGRLRTTTKTTPKVTARWALTLAKGHGAWMARSDAASRRHRCRLCWAIGARCRSAADRQHRRGCGDDPSGGGGLWWLRRNKAAGEGRDDQSARAKAAIARDNADQVMREVTAGYRDDMASLVAQLAEVRTDAATNRAAVSVVRDELKRIDSSLTGLRSELQQAIRDERAGAQGAAMIAAANALSDRLTAAMRDIERRGGDHVSR